MAAGRGNNHGKTGQNSGASWQGQLSEHTATDGETCICIATGPSLTADDCAAARESGHRLIGINDAYRLVRPDILYACDARWWRVHIRRVKKLMPDTTIVSKYRGKADDFCFDMGIVPVPSSGSKGLGREKIHHGANSGYQAINLAFLLGYKRILLIGYDMRGTGDRSHFFGSHPTALGLTNGTYTAYARNFVQLAEDLSSEGVEVLNCTPGSALDCFPAARLSDSL